MGKIIFLHREMPVDLPMFLLVTTTKIAKMQRMTDFIVSPGFQ
jgi:hypothetical protein